MGPDIVPVKNEIENVEPKRKPDVHKQGSSSNQDESQRNQNSALKLPLGPLATQKKPSFPILEYKRGEEGHNPPLEAGGSHNLGAEIRQKVVRSKLNINTSHGPPASRLKENSNQSSFLHSPNGSKLPTASLRDSDCISLVVNPLPKCCAFGPAPAKVLVRELRESWVEIQGSAFAARALSQLYRAWKARAVTTQAATSLAWTISRLAVKEAHDDQRWRRLELERMWKNRVDLAIAAQNISGTKLIKLSSSMGHWRWVSLRIDGHGHLSWPRRLTGRKRKTFHIFDILKVDLEVDQDQTLKRIVRRKRRAWRLAQGAKERKKEHKKAQHVSSLSDLFSPEGSPSVGRERRNSLLGLLKTKLKQTPPTEEDDDTLNATECALWFRVITSRRNFYFRAKSLLEKEWVTDAIINLQPAVHCYVDTRAHDYEETLMSKLGTLRFLYLRSSGSFFRTKMQAGMMKGITFRKSRLLGEQQINWKDIRHICSSTGKHVTMRDPTWNGKCPKPCACCYSCGFTIYTDQKMFTFLLESTEETNFDLAYWTLSAIQHLACTFSVLLLRNERLAKIVQRDKARELKKRRRFLSKLPCPAFERTGLCPNKDQCPMKHKEVEENDGDGAGSQRAESDT